MPIKVKLNNGKYNEYDNITELINDLYYNLLIINDDKIKKLISNNGELFVMYDISTENLYLVPYDEIYERLKNSNFKPINGNIYELIKKTKKKKMIDFLSNFNIDDLENTFYKYIVKKIPEIGNMSECIRPSYMPFLRTTTPYYTKQELIYLALNLGIWEDNINMKKICEAIQLNDISSDTLLNHQIYIRENNASGYIKYYTFIGSSIFNNYLRNSIYYDKYLTQNIKDFVSLIKKAPAYDKPYYLYRWINKDKFLKHLKPGDIWTDNSFMSTTRQPFVDPNESYFGYILVKIKIPANVEGVALAIEYYSIFPEELEIILAPSKFKLISNTGVKYYHPDEQTNNKVVSKYIFEWIEHNNEYLDHISKENVKEIPKIDFRVINYGTMFNEKITDFKRQTGEIFSTMIGNENIIFRMHDIETGAYDKFFYHNVSMANNQNNATDSFFLIWLDDKTGNINMMIEVGNIISVNYYFRYTGGETKIIGDYKYEDIIEFLNKLAKYFGLGKIIIHPNYSTFWNIIDKSIFDDIDIEKMHSYHIKQLYMCDTNYVSQYLLYNISILSMKDVYISEFTKFIMNNELYKGNISIDALYFILNMKLTDFIDDFKKEKDIIYDSYVEMIIRIAYKLLKQTNIKPVSKRAITHSISTINKNIIPGYKVSDLFNMIINKYNYLMLYLLDYIYNKYKLNIDNVFQYYIIDEKYSMIVIQDIKRTLKINQIIKIKSKYNIVE